MLILVTMRSDQVRAIHGTIDGDFAVGAAADRADFFAFGRTETIRLAFLADRTGHGKQDTRAPDENKIMISRRRPHQVEVEEVSRIPAVSLAVVGEN